MTDAANITALAELKPDYMGLIFYPKSKRFVGELNIRLLETIRESIKLTGVFVNENLDLVINKIKQYHLKAVQLHGDETPQYCRLLRDQSSQANCKIEIIKAFGIDANFDFNDLEAYVDVVDFFLFDTKTPAYGGSGIKFNWDILKNYQCKKQYFLSGGIDTEDMSELRLLNDVRIYAVDLNSKFEISPGLKDIEKLRGAVDILRS